VVFGILYVCLHIEVENICSEVTLWGVLSRYSWNISSDMRLNFIHWNSSSCFCIQKYLHPLEWTILAKQEVSTEKFRMLQHCEEIHRRWSEGDLVAFGHWRLMWTQ
jgi:GH35 family endo-1,4-beta-xylanase